MIKNRKTLTALLIVLLFAPAAFAIDAVTVLTGGAASTTGEAPAASADTPAPAARISTEPSQPFEPQPDAASCTARGDEIAKLLENWSALKTDEAAARFGVSEEAVTRRTETLTVLKNAYPSIVNALSRKQQIDDELAKQKNDAASPELTLTDKPPYSLKYYDAYIDRLDDLRSQIEEAQADLDRYTASAEALQKLISEREAAWRLARDNYTKGKTPETSWALNGAAYLLESARAQYLATTLSKDNAAAELAARKLKREREANVQTYIRDNLDLTEKGFEAQVAELDAQVKELEAKRPALNRQYLLAANAYQAANARLAAAKDDAAKAAAAMERDMRSAEHERLGFQLDHLQGQLVVLAAHKRLWTLRYDLARGAADLARIPDTVKELTDEERSLREELTTAQKDLLSLQSRHSSVMKQIDAEGTDPKILAVLRKHRVALQNSIDSCLSYVSALFSISAQERALIAELQQKYKTVSVWEKAMVWWRDTGSNVLNTELWQSGGYAVRLREFLIALALIVLGNWAARRAIAMLIWLLGKKITIDETSDRSLTRLLSYAAGIGIFLGALHIVGIPLTAFAFLGGAIAIGIGFGTQNLFKNLMSGLLLMLKRPFRLGNVVEVGGVIGRVSDIGISSTVVRTFDEKEVVIPNSDLLEKQLVNWSLSDQMQRRAINVGVEYGTSPALVRDTMLAVLAPFQERSEVLKKPEPWVCFADFGDSSLDFTLYFWINQRRVSGVRIESDVRMAIVDAFDKAGISMAFPHLDVNMLKFPSPLPQPLRRDDDRSLQA